MACDLHTRKIVQMPVKDFLMVKTNFPRKITPQCILTVRSCDLLHKSYDFCMCHVINIIEYILFTYFTYAVVPLYGHAQM